MKSLALSNKKRTFACRISEGYGRTYKQRIADRLLERKVLGEGAASLTELANNIDTDKMPAPSFMAVIIGVGKYAYRRKDGVYVLPVGCLKD